MLFNSKFLIKWKVLLKAREQQLQQDSACSTDLDQRSTVKEVEGLWGLCVSVPGLVRVGRKQASGCRSGCSSFLLSSAGLEKQKLVCLRTGEKGLRRSDFRSTTYLWSHW